MTTSPQILSSLADFDTPTICNVIELFEIRPRNTGYMDGTIIAKFPELAPVVGFACTATYRTSQSGVKSETIYESLERQVRLIEESPGPAFVVSQDLDQPAVGATFGEVMCGFYKSLGSVGLIASGGGRDFAQIRKLQYPVFSGKTICSHAYCHAVEIGIPIHVGGLLVQNGDLLHGDGNGVTNIPLEIATEIVDLAPEYIQAESLLTEYTNSSESITSEELMSRRRAMGEAINALRRRVSRSSQ